MKSFAVAVTLFCAGCLDGPGVECGGLLCPSDKVCAPSNDVCVFASQIAACTGKADGDACIVDGDGICHGGACILAACGNRIVEPGEACDDGNRVGGDGCSANCNSNEQCGNGVVDPTTTALETCDCGESSTTLPFGCSQPNSDDPAATCDTHCHLHGCGDGLLQATEQCDGTNLGTATDCTPLGFYAGTPTCNRFCQLDTTTCAGRCGDGMVNGPELCDGNIPRNTSCLDLGEDAGNVSCDARLCVASPAHCTNIGWRLSPALSNVKFLWTNSATDIYALTSTSVAPNVIYRFDGLGWTVLPTVPIAPVGASISSLWASGPTDVWAVGASGYVGHFDGTTWTSSTPTTTSLTGVWGSASNNVFIVGELGVILHWDGTRFAMMVSGIATHLARIHGRSAIDIYAVGTNGVLHYDGSAWSTALNKLNANYAAVWVAPTGQVFAVGDHSIGRFDGTTWVDGPPNGSETYFTGWQAVWGSSATDVFAVGGVAVEHFDGTRWSPLAPNLLMSLDYQVAVSGTSARNVFIGGGQGIRFFAGADWLVEKTDPSATGPDELNGLWISSTSTAVAVGYHLLTKKAGTSGIWIPKVPAPTYILSAVWGLSDTDVFVADSFANILHYDGTSLTSMTTTAGAIQLWGTSHNDVYAGGFPPHHYDGVSWTAITAVNDSISATWGSASNDVYMVSEDAIWHFDGSKWVKTSVGGSLNDIWGSGANDVFAVGNDGFVLHFDGSSWSPMTSGINVDIRNVEGRGPNDVFAVGIGGNIIHWDGIAWTPVRSPTTLDFVGLRARPEGIYILATDGTIYTLQTTVSPWP